MTAPTIDNRPILDHLAHILITEDAPPWFVRSQDRINVTLEIQDVRNGTMMGDDDVQRQ